MVVIGNAFYNAMKDVGNSIKDLISTMIYGEARPQNLDDEDSINDEDILKTKIDDLLDVKRRYYENFIIEKSIYDDSGQRYIKKEFTEEFKTAFHYRFVQMAAYDYEMEILDTFLETDPKKRDENAKKYEHGEYATASLVMKTMDNAIHLEVVDYTHITNKLEMTKQMMITHMIISRYNFTEEEANEWYSKYDEKAKGVKKKISDAVKTVRNKFKKITKGRSKLGTAITNKVNVIAQDESLANWIKESFKDGLYETVETTEDIIVYRAFGRKAVANGGFVTTFKSTSKQEVMEKLALLPEWVNTLESVATIKIPKGTILNIGKVAEQISETGQVFEGGADQILMPKNWSDSWIIDISPFN